MGKLAGSWSLRPYALCLAAEQAPTNGRHHQAAYPKLISSHHPSASPNKTNNSDLDGQDPHTRELTPAPPPLPLPVAPVASDAAPDMLLAAGPSLRRAEWWCKHGSGRHARWGGMWRGTQVLQLLIHTRPRMCPSTPFQGTLL